MPLSTKLLNDAREFDVIIAGGKACQEIHSRIGLPFSQF